MPPAAPRARAAHGQSEPQRVAAARAARSRLPMRLLVPRPSGPSQSAVGQVSQSHARAPWTNVTAEPCRQHHPLAAPLASASNGFCRRRATFDAVATAAIGAHAPAPSAVLAGSPDSGKPEHREGRRVRSRIDLLRPGACRRGACSFGHARSRRRDSKDLNFDSGSVSRPKNSRPSRLP